MHASFPMMCDEVLQPVHDLLLVGAGSHGLHACKGVSGAIDVVPVPRIPLFSLYSQMYLIVLVYEKPTVNSAAIWKVVSSLPVSMEN